MQYTVSAIKKLISQKKYPVFWQFFKVGLKCCLCGLNYWFTFTKDLSTGKRWKLSKKNIRASKQRPKLKLKNGFFWRMAYQNLSKGIKKVSFQHQNGLMLSVKKNHSKDYQGHQLRCAKNRPTTLWRFFYGRKCPVFGSSLVS